jgi:thioredoxin-related protein
MNYANLKHILIAIPLAFLMAFVPAKKPAPKAELKWYDWNEGYAKATKEGKIVLVDAYTDWCGWCKKMDRDTYSNADIIKKINEHFVPIKFNPEVPYTAYKVGENTYNNQELFHMMTRGQSTGFPTIYYIYTKKMSIFVDPGYKGPDAFMQALDAAIAENKK